MGGPSGPQSSGPPGQPGRHVSTGWMTDCFVHQRGQVFPCLENSLHQAVAVFLEVFTLPELANWRSYVRIGRPPVAVKWISGTRLLGKRLPVALYSRSDSALSFRHCENVTFLTARGAGTGFMVQCSTRRLTSAQPSPPVLGEREQPALPTIRIVRQTARRAAAALVRRPLITQVRVGRWPAHRPHCSASIR